MSLVRFQVLPHKNKVVTKVAAFLFTPVFGRFRGSIGKPVFFMSCVNFAQSKQEKFNISNSPEYPSKLFHFGIKRFRRRICTPVVEIIQDSLIVILKSFWSR